jgi:hypothetical protein
MYHPDSVEFMRTHNLTLGLHQDPTGKWCKDFFRVVYEHERRSDWAQTLPTIKQRLEKSEREILMEVHLGLLEGQEGKDMVQKKILGHWSFVSRFHSLANVGV